MASRSARARLRSAAAAFSSMRCGLRVPGIGTPLEGARLPARVDVTHIGGVVGAGGLGGAGDDAAAQRGVGDEPDAQLPQDREQLLDVPLEQRELSLQDGNGLDDMRAADGLRAGLAQAEVFHLARVDQLLDGSCHILDRHLGVDAVLVEHIDVVDAEVAQAVVGDLADVAGAAVESAAEGELGGHVETE